MLVVIRTRKTETAQKLLELIRQIRETNDLYQEIYCPRPKEARKHA